MTIIQDCNGKIHKPKRVRLPNGKTLNLYSYVPDGYTASGKIKLFVPSSSERDAFKQRELAYLKTLNQEPTP